MSEVEKVPHFRMRITLRNGQQLERYFKKFELQIDKLDLSVTGWTRKDSELNPENSKLVYVSLSDIVAVEQVGVEFV